MNFPVVYDVLIRAEVEARDTYEAARYVAELLMHSGSVPEGFCAAFEVIRDDNVSGEKDNASRHTNGFAVFTSAQKHALIGRITEALDAATKGDKEPV